MGYGVKLIFQLELMMNDGLNWSTLWSKLFPYDILSAGTIICFMSYTSIALMGIFIFVVPIPFFNLFTKNFWSTRRDFKYKKKYRKGAEQREVDSNFEIESENRTPGIRIQNLTKAYVKKKAVVRNLSLNIYKNEITMLCGANGAGKTTLLLILAGIIKAT